MSLFTALILLLVLLLALLYAGKLGLMFYQAFPAQHNDQQMLLNTIKRLSDRAGITPPKLCIIQQKGYNAFSTRYGFRNVIAITPDLIQLLSEHELEGVLAHEIAHIHLHQSSGQRLGIFAMKFMRLALQQLQALLVCCLSGSSHPLRHLLANSMTPKIHRWYSHNLFQAKEFQADAFAAKLCGSPDHLAAALNKIDYANHRLGLHSHHTWHSSHPPVSERIRRLEAMRFGAYLSIRS